MENLVMAQPTPNNPAILQTEVPSSTITAPARDEEAELGIKRIGEYPVAFGAYSDVYMAEMTQGDTKVTVALKVLRPIVSPDRLQKREGREKICMSAHHDNIAQFYTVYHLSNGSPVFVSQWYDNGTAADYLKKNPAADPMKIIYGIACGIEHLHATGIVHGDLKGSNVLVDDTGAARLIDFGLSRRVDAGPCLDTTTPTTLRWCAPELLRQDDACPTKSSDVYAFASTALELLTGVVPYSKLGSRLVPEQVIKGVAPRDLTSGVRYTIPRCAELWELLECCWGKSNARPHMRDVRLRLEELL